MKLKILTIIIVSGIMIAAGVTTYNYLNNNIELTFTDNIAFYINEDVEVSTAEYLLYAASIIQSTEKEYSSEVWKTEVTLDDGNKITYEEYMRQQIVEQMRMTYLLFLKAKDYDVELTQEEKEKVSADAQAYLESISDYNVGDVGVDLSTVLSIYTENALADQVYTTILNSVKRDENMSDDEYYQAKLDHFNKEYEIICKELSPKWTYKEYANDSILSSITLANEDSDNQDNANKTD